MVVVRCVHDWVCVKEVMGVCVVVVVRCVHDWVCVKEVMGVCGGDGCVWW